MLSREQICDLLWELGASEVIDNPSNKWIRFTCTVHNESNPSAGVLVEENIYNCFACGSSGTLDWLCFNSDRDRFKSVNQARLWLEKRYKVKLYDTEEEDTPSIFLDYDDVQEKKKQKIKPVRKVLPLTTIAPFRSGKETYEYFYKRGFTKETVKSFKIGRDIVSKTVTVPIFYEDGKLAGVIGRYISKNRRKNERYKVYEFEKGSVTFPQDKLQVKDDTIILVEGVLDAIWLHQLGYPNAQAIMGNHLTSKQANYLMSKAHTFIRMFDNDLGGKQAKASFDKAMHNVKVLDVAYPEGTKDVQECTKEQVDHMVANATNKWKLRFIPK